MGVIGKREETALGQPEAKSEGGIRGSPLGMWKVTEVGSSGLPPADTS